jgi:hypothetical protein
MADESRRTVDARIDKLRRLLAEELITPHEFANALLDRVANAWGGDTRLADRVALRVPPGAQKAVEDVAESVVAGDVRGPTFRIGPGLSAVDLAEVTPKLQAWASALLERLRSERTG